VGEDSEKWNEKEVFAPPLYPERLGIIYGKEKGAKIERELQLGWEKAT